MLMPTTDDVHLAVVNILDADRCRIVFAACDQDRPLVGGRWTTRIHDVTCAACRSAWGI